MCLTHTEILYSWFVRESICSSVDDDTNALVTNAPLIAIVVFLSTKLTIPTYTAFCCAVFTFMIPVQANQNLAQYHLNG